MGSSALPILDNDLDTSIFAHAGLQLIHSERTRWVRERIRRIALSPSFELKALADPLDLPTSIASLILAKDTPARLALCRALLKDVGCDESLPSRWLLEHKMVQNLILRALLGDSVPLSIGARELDKNKTEEIIAALFPAGWVVKPCFGYGSTRERTLSSRDSWSRKDAVLADDAQIRFEPSAQTFIVQELINTVAEYRVHTLGRCVITSMILRTHGEIEPPSSSELQEVAAQVNRWIAALPPAMISRSFCGWDVGRDEAGRLRLFEINWSGVHQTYEKGFHCSGTLWDPRLGELYMARLVLHIEECFHVTVDLRPLSFNVEQAEIAQMCLRVDNWRRLLASVAELHLLWRQTYTQPTPLGLPIRALVSSNRGSSNDAFYATTLDWLKKVAQGF